MKYGYTAEEKVIAWLDGFEGLTYRQKARILSLCPHAAAFVADLEGHREELLEIVPAETFASMRKALREENRLAALLSNLAEKDIFFVTIRSADYPECLRATPAPPLILYGRGDRALLQRAKFAVVGSRRTPAWAQALTREFAARLSEHFAIVTGIAEGGDVSAVRGVLEREKTGVANVVCVLAYGFGHVYPAAHADILKEVCRRGLALTEHRPSVAPQKFLFPVRNRIIAGLSRGVLVVSGGKKSGTAVTANYALDYGRDVFAFPYNPGISSGAGCNALLKSGAYPADCVEDILGHYGLRQEERAAPALGAEEEKLLRVLAERGEAHIEELARLTEIPAYLAGGILSGLEVKGMVVRAGGNRYASVGIPPLAAAEPDGGRE